MKWKTRRAKEKKGREKKRKRREIDRHRQNEDKIIDVFKARDDEWKKCYVSYITWWASSDGIMYASIPCFLINSRSWLRRLVVSVGAMVGGGDIDGNENGLQQQIKGEIVLWWNDFLNLHKILLFTIGQIWEMRCEIVIFQEFYSNKKLNYKRVIFLFRRHGTLNDVPKTNQFTLKSFPIN